MEEYSRTWGVLTGSWVPHDTRDAIVDYTRLWSEKAEIPLKRFVSWLSVAQSKFYTVIRHLSSGGGQRTSHSHQISPSLSSDWTMIWAISLLTVTVLPGSEDSTAAAQSSLPLRASNRFTCI